MPKIRHVKRPTPTAVVSEAASTSIAAPPKALVFISHDTRDADLAEAFAELVADVSVGTVKSFRSSDNKGTTGIEFGENWYTAILAKLGEATDVVALLTTNSIDRPWILYEAGIAAGKLNTRVMGIALGVPLTRATSGPFGQFQNSTDEEEPITKLMMQLLRRNPDAAPREEAVRMQVKIFRDKVKKILDNRGSAENDENNTSDEQNIAKMFEEVKEMVRELPERVGDSSLSRRGSARRMRRLSPMVLDEIMHGGSMFPERKEGRAAAWLIFLSIIREDVPWLYEPGMEFYHALRSGHASKIQNASKNLMAIAEMTSRSEFFHDFLRGEDKEGLFALRHLDDFLHHILNRL